jgi:asparagine synthase (glutamine-hydrolysing)
MHTMTVSAQAAHYGCFDPHHGAPGALTLTDGWTLLSGTRGTAAIAGTFYGQDNLSGDALLQGRAIDADGRYALAACDDAGQALRLARDPAGSVALYWHRDGAGRVHFATTLHALLARLPAAPALSRNGLHEYLRFLDVAAPNTLFDGVCALEAGQAMTFGARGAPAPAAVLAAPAVPADYAAACTELEARLRDAIARRLAGSRASACFLSGGVDSALLCALARADGHRIDAWTVGFDAAELDESPTAARIAQHLGVPHHVLRVDADALEAAFGRAHAQAEQPYCDPAGAPTRLAFEACAAHADRVLDGTGAEALPGEMPARWRRIAHDWIAPLPAGLRRAATQTLRALPGLDGYARMTAFATAQDLFIRWQGFSAEDIQRLTGHVPDFSGTHFYRCFEALRGASPLRRQAVLQGLALPDDRLQQAALATGLRVEHPFAAPDVSALMQALPEPWCHRPDRPKRVLRDLLARHVPEAVWASPKRGFNIDLPGLLRGHDLRLVRRYLCDAAALARLPLDPDEVVRWRDRFMAGDDGATHRVWALLNLSAWLESRGNAASVLAAQPRPRLQ